MKTTIFIAVLLLICAGCTSQQSDQLTEQQKDQIKNEVKLVVHDLIAIEEKLDSVGTFQYYADVPEFIAFNADGSRSDFQSMKKSAFEMFSASTSISIPTAREDYIVLAKDLVICAWLGKGNIAFKSGDKVSFDPDAVTLIFKKIAGQWKVIYSHESAIITTQKAGKK